MKLAIPFATAGLLLAAAPAAAQDEGPRIDDDPFAGSAYDGDYLSVGGGAVYGPSYTGSDDYVISVLPIVQGSLGGIDISPRAGGVELDFLPDAEGPMNVKLGLAARIRNNRASQIEDPVVESLGELDTAYEVGPSAGLGISGVLHSYDSISFGVDAMWDVAGAHDGMTINPSISYFTPLSQGIAATLSLGAEYADEDFQDYYFAVSPAQSAATGGVLPAFDPDGGGFTSAGANLLVGIDLDGNLRNGGLGLVLIGGYSRVLGDAKRSPFTSVVGSANGWRVGAGIGYTF